MIRWKLHLRGNQHGVTLLELMIVVVIIGIMAAMAVPEFVSATPKLRAKAAVRDIVSTLRETRSMAVARKEPCGVNFDQANGRYTMFIDRELPQNQTFSAGDSVVSVTTLDAEVRMNFQTFSGGTVIFNPDGSATATGDVSLSSSDYATTYDVNVLASTGRVRLDETL